MLSVFDVVWEKANFRQSFQGVIDKLQIEKIDRITEKSTCSFCGFYSELCLRVAFRLIHLYNHCPEIAYGDLLYNAIQMHEEEDARKLISDIVLDDDFQTVNTLLKLTALYARYDKGYYSLGNENLHPDINKISASHVECTQFFVKQIQKFEKKYHNIPAKECQFDGAYNDIISKGYCGMPTYLVEDTIWVFNLGQGSKWGVILFLIAYVMGMHSTIQDYKNVSCLGIFNVNSGVVETINISEISDKTFSAICMNYIGYETPRVASAWLSSSDTSRDRFDNAIQYHNVILNKHRLNEFNPGKYDDGIFQITYPEYWQYYEKNIDSLAIMPTKPTYIETVFMMKRDKYLMFVAEGETGLYLLQGGKFKHLVYNDIHYYYNNLKEYGDKIYVLFEKYWNALDQVSCFVKNLNISSLGAESGAIHGCIVDIDFYNHIYVNPFDGKVTPYYAKDVSSRKPYENLASLVSEQRPELVKQFQELCNNKYELDTFEDKPFVSLISSDITISEQISTEKDIYKVSRIMGLFQKVRDANLICVWIDGLLLNPSKLIDLNE